MDNSKLDQGKSPSSSLSQIKVKQGTSDGPEREKESSVAETIRASNSEAKQNRNLTPPSHPRKSSDDGSQASDAAVVDRGSPIASVKDAVSKFGSPIGSVRDAASKFGGAANWKTNRVQPMEVLCFLISSNLKLLLMSFYVKLYNTAIKFS